MTEEKSPDNPGTRPSVKSRLVTAVITAAAVILICVLVMAFVLSASLSPLASIHDGDGDSYPDSVDTFPDDSDEWSDRDEDGVGDNSDAFPLDANESADADSDGVGDNSDDFPEDPEEWDDLDDDGVGDNSDAFPYLSTEWTDLDGDGVGDNSDDLPNDATEWYDTDGDGVGDNSDAFPADPDADTPTVVISLYLADSMTIMVEVEDTNLGVPWDSVLVILSDGNETASWQLSSEGLEDMMSVWDFGSALLGDMNVILMVADGLGGGRLDVLDMITFTSVLSEFTADSEWTITLVYIPTMKNMASIQVSGLVLEDTPVAALTMTLYSTGYKFTVVSISASVEWSEVVIMLEGGGESEFWFPSSAELTGDLASVQELDPGYFDAFYVFLNVTDMAGNGEIDAGDYFTLAAGGGTWEYDVEYTVSIIHLPTFGTIAMAAFHA